MPEKERGVAKRVWVVDDEPLIRTAVLAVLGELGYETRGFGNAEDLYVALVEGSIPDLLVLDQRLPDEYGSTILHSLRERAAGHASVAEVRGRGLMLAIEFADPDGLAPRPDLAKAFLAEAMARNVLLLTCGTHGQAVRIIPPLVTTDNEVEMALAAISESLEAIGA